MREKERAEKGEEEGEKRRGGGVEKVEGKQGEEGQGEGEEGGSAFTFQGPLFPLFHPSLGVALPVFRASLFP